MSASAGTGSEHNGKEAFFDEEIQHQFYELIRSATQNIIFVTPYIELWVHLQDEMRVASQEESTSHFSYEKTRLRADPRTWNGSGPTGSRYT